LWREKLIFLQVTHATILEIWNKLARVRAIPLLDMPATAASRIRMSQEKLLDLLPVGVTRRFSSVAVARSIVSLSLSLATGTTPDLIRWYRVRDEVLENVRKVEIYRDRLVFDHITFMSQ
jgi:hypothetical protein